MTAPAPRARPDGRAVALVLVGLVAAFLYSNFLLDWVLRDFAGMGEIVSELEAPGEANATLLRLTDVVSVVLVAGLLPWVRRGMPAGAFRELAVWMTVVFVVCTTIAAAVPTPCPPGQECTGPGVGFQTLVHDGSSIVADTALYLGLVAAWWATRAAGPRWFRSWAVWIFWLGGVGATALFEYFNVTGDPPWAVGYSQRVHILFMSAWIVCLAVFAATRGLRTGAGQPGTGPEPHRTTSTARHQDGRHGTR